MLVSPLALCLFASICLYHRPRNPVCQKTLLLPKVQFCLMENSLDGWSLKLLVETIFLGSVFGLNHIVFEQADKGLALCCQLPISQHNFGVYSVEQRSSKVKIQHCVLFTIVRVHSGDFLLVGRLKQTKRSNSVMKPIRQPWHSHILVCVCQSVLVKQL